MSVPKTSISSPIVIIENRALVGETLARYLRKEFDCQVVSFPDIGSWQRDSSGLGAQFILVGASENNHEAAHTLSASEIGATLIVLSETTELDDIVRSLKAGTCAGPTNESLRQ